MTIGLLAIGLICASLGALMAHRRIDALEKRVDDIRKLTKFIDIFERVKDRTNKP